MGEWIEVCAADDIEEEDLIRWDYESRSFAVLQHRIGLFSRPTAIAPTSGSISGTASVIGTVIECPLHQGRFDIATGKALTPPVCEDLATYPVVVENGIVFVRL